eukprot:GHRR01029165.1.p3 GENE.GHRR01029165.1~~GHRR01029165.1.p3  ORF type:complete len:103 (-),score=27.83 GHRR01029165.1:315-623(-)
MVLTKKQPDTLVLQLAPRCSALLAIAAGCRSQVPAVEAGACQRRIAAGPWHCVCDAEAAYHKQHAGPEAIGDAAEVELQQGWAASHAAAGGQQFPVGLVKIA